ncbi:hypothetical protein [Halostreptopolyspora alba]|uniref:Uncharacterized protein n=1 Tax=Halostreptopolyspora alba TaxID=2487137 RepID=A0A3N0EDB0_9ACTN|nr:hypothetical protein EFW17_07605 [Nocardiopsaceae bacterium YIM 96095]
MFQLARTSAKAVLVAAGAAGFVALGAGVASADALGVPGAVQPQPAAPSVSGQLSELTGGTADQVNRLGNELPEAEAPASVTGPETLPQSAEVPGEVDGSLPGSAEEVTDQVPEAGTGTVRDEVDHLADRAPVDAPDTSNVNEPTGATDEVVGKANDAMDTVEDTDVVGELREAETQVL